MNTSAHDDLWTSGRLSKLARCYGRNENESLGALMSVYRLTQRAKAAVASSARFVTIVVLAFEDESDADKFLTAMIRAQLASVLADGDIIIHGNKERIEEQEEWLRGVHARASAGGKARAASGKRNASGRFEKPNDLPAAPPATVQQPSSHHQQNQPVFSLKSLVLDLRGEGEAKPPPPAEVTEREIKPIDATHVAMHYGTYRALLKQHQKREAPPRPTQKSKWALEAIANATLGDCTRVLEAFVKSTNPYYAKKGWSLELLETDLPEIFQTVKSGAPSVDKAKRDADYERARQASIEAFERGES